MSPPSSHFLFSLHIFFDIFRDILHTYTVAVFPSFFFIFSDLFLFIFSSVVSVPPGPSFHRDIESSSLIYIFSHYPPVLPSQKKSRPLLLLHLSGCRFGSAYPSSFLLLILLPSFQLEDRAHCAGVVLETHPSR